MSAPSEYPARCVQQSKRDNAKNFALNADKSAERKTTRMNKRTEKPGLLPGRPREDGIHCDSHGEARRPADVWLPRGMSSTSGRPEALDFAVTCGLTSDKVWKSAESPHVLFEDYCDFKQQYKDTGQLCSNQGLVFTPLVFEAHGGGGELQSQC